MNLAWYSQDDVSVLTICGRLDTHGAAHVSEWLDDAANHDRARIVVDLSKATFIDSTGLATLVKALRRCRQYGGDLALSGLQQPVQVIFKVTRLDQAFGIYPTEQAALAALGARSGQPHAVR